MVKWNKFFHFERGILHFLHLAAHTIEASRPWVLTLLTLSQVQIWGNKVVI